MGLKPFDSSDSFYIYSALKLLIFFLIFILKDFQIKFKQIKFKL